MTNHTQQLFKHPKQSRSFDRLTLSLTNYHNTNDCSQNDHGTKQLLNPAYCINNPQPFDNTQREATMKGLCFADYSSSVLIPAV